MVDSTLGGVVFTYTATGGAVTAAKKSKKVKVGGVQVMYLKGYCVGSNESPGFQEFLTFWAVSNDYSDSLDNFAQLFGRYSVTIITRGQGF